MVSPLLPPARMHDYQPRIVRERYPPPPPNSGESPKEAKARAKADKAYAKASRPWYQKKRFIIPGVLVLLMIVVAALSGGDADEIPAASEPAASVTPESTTPADSTDEETAATSSAPSATASASEPASTPSTAPSTPSAEPTPAGGSTVGIGESANDGKFEFIVNAFECGEDSVGDDPFTEEAQGQFCLMDIQVTNTGNEAQFMFADNQYLHDDQGREFSADSRPPDIVG